MQPLRNNVFFHTSAPHECLMFEIFDKKEASMNTNSNYNNNKLVLKGSFKLPLLLAESE